MRYHILLSICLLSACISTSCKDEDDPYNPEFSVDAPAGAITQELGAYWHGRTLLGKTNIYINENGEFAKAEDKGVDKCGIVNVGQRESFETEAFPEGFNWDMTVTPGNFYQIFTKDSDLRGAHIRPGSKYINMQVNSYLYDKKERIGAKVTYAEVTAKNEYLDTCYRNDLIVYSHPGGDEETIIYLDGLDFANVIDWTTDYAGSIYVSWKSPNELHVITNCNVKGEVDLAIYLGAYYDIRKLYVIPEGSQP